MKSLNNANCNMQTHAQGQNEQEQEKKKKRYWLLLLLLLLLLGICAGGSYYFKKIMPQPNGTIKIQNGEENEDGKKDPLDGLYVTYSGITDTTISDKSVVELKNLKENGDIIMKFEIYENSKLLYSSDYIKSGEHINWEAGKDLSVGEHTLSVIQTPQIEVDGEYIPLTSGTCECILTKI